MLTDTRIDIRTVIIGALACALLACLCSAASAADYRLGAGDLVRISVFGAPELASETRVSESGSITYPLVGQLEVVGRSAAEVESMLRTRLIEGGFVRDPQITVMIAEYQSQKVSVLGHVTKAGQYVLQSSSRVLDMIAAAGGLVLDEAAETASLVRADGTTMTIDLAALFAGDPAQNVPVAGGDTIFVPRAPQFFVYGEVNKPGMYRLERGMTVSRAISVGGGLTPRGSERRVVIKRRTQGREVLYRARDADRLQADDVVFVKEGFF